VTNRGPFIRLRSGRQFHLADPREDEIEISDVVHALSRLPRYTGHTRRPYYVLQHVCYCHDIANPEYRREALMHDAAEAMTNDISSPLKSLLPDFKRIEQHIETVLAQKFNLRYPWPDEVKRVDLVMLATELRDLMNGADWSDLPHPPMTEHITPWDSAKCRREFYRRYRRLFCR
jgi:hypothetical protein